MENNTKLKQLKSKLLKIENQLSSCRTSVLQDGWQTQKHARKARKWDVLAQEKMKIIQQIYVLENDIIIKSYNDLFNN